MWIKWNNNLLGNENKKYIEEGTVQRRERGYFKYDFSLEYLVFQARDVYEEAIQTVMTVRDFGQVS